MNNIQPITSFPLKRLAEVQVQYLDSGPDDYNVARSQARPWNKGGPGQMNLVSSLSLA